MKKINKLGSLLLISAISIVGCNNNQVSSDNKISRQKDSEVEEFDGNYNNSRKYSEDYFNNPNNIYRILPTRHDHALAPGGASITTFEELMEMGYGGVTTNVAWLNNAYMKDEDAWELMDEAISYGIEKLGMRVILYDELGYPSGAAHTNTLDNTPEGEDWVAQGLVSQILTLKSGGVTIPNLEGHTLLHIYHYTQNNIRNITGDLTNTEDLYPKYKAGDHYSESNDGILVCLYLKDWYEGTHYQNNLMRSRKYIDLLNPKTIQEFLRNTYQTYYSRFGKYFNNGIEAFFFDEPAMPGFYFDGSQVQPQIIDEPNESIPQLPTINFDPQVVDRFTRRYGYNPSPYLSYLFDDSFSNKESRRFRWQYYNMIGETIEDNFFGQIADWCENHNVYSTGHLLCEEDLYTHPFLMGSYMNDYRRMSIPGIDSTRGNVGNSIEMMSAVKAATSVSEFDGKQFTFCEIGQDESDPTWLATSSTVEENIANVAVLQTAGINYMASYYRYSASRSEEESLLANSLARINYMLAGNVADKNVAVYYPIEGIYCDVTPYGNGKKIYDPTTGTFYDDPLHPESTNVISTSPWGFNSNISLISDNYRGFLKMLTLNQIDYNLFDSYAILNSEVVDGSLKAPNGQKFDVIVIPYTTAFNDGVLQKLNEAANAGVEVILQGVNSALSMFEAYQGTNDSELATLKSHCNFVGGVNPTTLYSAVASSSKVQKVKLSNPSNFVVRKQTNANSTLYMIVNTSANEQYVTITADEVGTEYRDWNIYTGEVDGMVVNIRDGKSYLNIKLPAYGVGIYTIE